MGGEHLDVDGILKTGFILKTRSRMGIDLRIERMFCNVFSLSVWHGAVLFFAEMKSYRP